MKKWIKTKELIFICIVILISTILLIYQSMIDIKNKTVSIYYRNSLITSINLNNANNGKFKLSELENVEFDIKDGKISFINMSCPDKICEKYGYIGNSGEIAVCIPNRVYIKIEKSAEKSDVDAVTK